MRPSEYDLLMQKPIAASSGVWLITMAFAGAGSTFLGPFLPSLALLWHLQDSQTGPLLSCLFLGSFTGTLMLSDNLRRTLRIGAVAATAGLLIFSVCTRTPSGYLAGAAALLLTGIGLGQLMSSINLLVGSAPSSERPRDLANIGTAWCTGAVLSPLLSTVLIPIITPATRVALFAPLYLFPVLVAHGRKLPSDHAPLEIRVAPPSPLFSPLSILWITIFLIYGGSEASIAGWLPMFSARYRIAGMASSQWIVSIFWLGLIGGRILMAAIAARTGAQPLMRMAILASAASLLWFVAIPSPAALLFGIVLAGICVGPIFPLLLASVLEFRLGTRVMGFVLAACGIGAALFPSLLGTISNAFGLRLAMLIPLAGLLSLVFLSGQGRLPITDLR